MEDISGKFSHLYKVVLSKRFLSKESLGGEIPFFISDLKKVFKTGLFSLNDGRVAEFINIEYNFSKDTAVCSFSVRDKYTDRLEEVVYEPE